MSPLHGWAARSTLLLVWAQTARAGSGGGGSDSCSARRRGSAHLQSLPERLADPGLERQRGFGSAASGVSAAGVTVRRRFRSLRSQV